MSIFFQFGSRRQQAIRQEDEGHSRAALPDEIIADILARRARPHPESGLIAVLHKVQAHFGYLGQAQMDAVAQLMQIPTAKVTGGPPSTTFSACSRAGSASSTCA